MRAALLATGLLLASAGVAGWLYITAAAEDCNTGVGEVGQALDPDVRDQCRLAATIINLAFAVAVAGVVLAVVAAVL